MAEIELPDFVAKRLQLLSRKFNIPMDELRRRYLDIYNDPWVQNEAGFKDDYERHAYAIKVLTTRIAARPPSTEYYAIPYGITDIRISKTSGIPVSRIYLLAKPANDKDAPWEPHVLICRERQAELIYEVQLFHVYKIRASTGGGQALFATDETLFLDPIQPLTVDPIQFLEKKIGVRRFRLAEVHKALSRRRENGFVDEFDLRGIDAIVVDYRRGQRRDGTRYALYVVSDDSLIEDTVDEEGNLVPARLSVWVPPPLLKYDRDSELYLYGTLQLNSEGVPFMNAIGIVPIRARPLEG